MKPILTSTLYAISLFALAGCAASGTVMGTLVEAKNNRPVSEATITLTPLKGPYGYEAQSTKLNFGGNFTIKVKTGEYRLSVQHQSLVPCYDIPVIKVLGNDLQETEICMKPQE